MTDNADRTAPSYPWPSREQLVREAEAAERHAERAAYEAEVTAWRDKWIALRNEGIVLAHKWDTGLETIEEADLGFADMVSDLLGVIRRRYE